MAKKNINGILKLKVVVKKLQKSLLLGKKSEFYYFDDYEDIGSDSTNDVPEDVKEGHVAVLAVDRDVPKRFIVPLNYLAHPTIVRLLELAAEEYGFDREGALTIPCPPSELERILADEQWQENDQEGSTLGVERRSSANSMLQSY